MYCRIFDFVKFHSLRRAFKRFPYSRTKHQVAIPNSAHINFVTDGIDIEDLEHVQDLLVDNLLIYDDFVSVQEENMLYGECKSSLEKQVYQHEHWDHAIHSYRESEQEMWSKECMGIFKRMKQIAFNPEHELLPYVHVLDLNDDGYIKPHIDSNKFCGTTIAGLSLLSPSIMRYCHEKYSNAIVDVLLPRRSLYICRNDVRYQFTHEILPPELSVWRGNLIERKRRISIILRNKPNAAESE